MRKAVKQEIINLIKEYNLNCSIKGFKFAADWPEILYSKILSNDFIDKFMSHFDLTCWIIVSKRRGLSEETIRRYRDKVHWGSISYYQKLSESFIREFKERVNWYNICICQRLSEDFIDEHQALVDWKCVSIFQSLSEDFIRKHKDRVDWGHISSYQDLSIEFVSEFKDRIDFERLMVKRNLDNMAIKSIMVGTNLKQTLKKT